MGVFSLLFIQTRKKRQKKGETVNKSATTIFFTVAVIATAPMNAFTAILAAITLVQS